MAFRVDDVVAFRDTLAAAGPGRALDGSRRGRPHGMTDIQRIAREIAGIAVAHTMEFLHTLLPPFSREGFCWVWEHRRAIGF